MEFTELRKKANENDAEAQYLYAECFYEGKDVEREYMQAGKWLKKSAAQNYVKAQNLLGNCYMEGSGVDVDEK